MKKTYLLASGLASVSLFFGAFSLAHGVDNPAKGVKMEYFKNAQKMKIKSMNVEGTNAFLEDIVSSNDPKAPISCGLFRMEKGNSLTYTYTYPEVKIILDGMMTVSDGHSTVVAKKGDVLLFPVGSTIKFTSDNSGLGFICGQRAFDGA